MPGSNIIEIILKMTDKASGDFSAASKKFQAVGESLTRAGKSLTMGVTLPLAAAGGLALKAASDYEQAMGAVETVFEDAASTIKEYSESSATSVGLSAAAFSQLSTVTGAFLQNVGFNAGEAATETIKLTERAADMAAVFNTDVTTALNAIQSGLKGEFNPLEQFGVKMNMAAINAKALEMGLADTTKALTDNDKAAAALALIYEQTAKTQGTFAEEAGGMAGSMQILKAQFEEIGQEIGTVLMPFALKLIGFISGLVDKFQALSPATKEFIVYAGMLAAAIGPVLFIVGQLITAIGTISGAVSGLSAFFSVSLIPAIAAAVPAIGAFIAAALPVIAVIAAIGAAVYAMYLMWTNNFLGMQTKTKAVIDYIKENIEDWLWYMNRAVSTVTNFIKDNIEDWLWYVNRAINKIIDAFKIDWAGIGKDIIDGIKSGIVNAASSLADAARQAAQNAMDAVKGFLGIDSPSKVFAEIGQNISQGLAQGITGEKAPIQAITGTAGAMVSTAEGGGGMVNNFYITGGDPRTIAQEVINEIRYRTG